MKAHFGHKHGKMTVIVCYVQTNDSDDATKEDFYSAMSRCLATVPPPPMIKLFSLATLMWQCVMIWVYGMAQLVLYPLTHLTTMGSTYLNCADLTTFTLQTPTSNAKLFISTCGIVMTVVQRKWLTTSLFPNAGDHWWRTAELTDQQSLEMQTIGLCALIFGFTSMHNDRKENLSLQILGN